MPSETDTTILYPKKWYYNPGSRPRTLKQFVGDEIMVISGSPQSDDSHALRVCRTAVQVDAG